MITAHDLYSMKGKVPHNILHYLKEKLSEQDQARLLTYWPFWARPQQLAPVGDWTHWLLLAGRGFGKTRTGAEWIRHLVETGQAGRIALVAPTSADAREVMIEGESGLAAIASADFRPRYEPSKRRLTWPNGAIATAYSADEPERLRGPQHDAAWCDELCAWRLAAEAFDMLMFGLRLGQKPRTCITTTPKPTRFLKKLMTHPGIHITRGSTFDNIDNLAPSFAKDILTRYEGTSIGRQELYAEIIEEVAGALWNRSLLDSLRVSSVPAKFDRLIVAIDPPAGSSGDECGLIAAGICGPTAYILEDWSKGGLSPRGWAERAVRLYHHIGADRMVAEVNQGGAMIEALIRTEDKNISYRPLFAGASKAARAEPVAALYEQGRVKHTAIFTELEDQMCAFTSPFDRQRMGYSPDRVDALVWAISELLLSPKSTHKISKI